MEPRTLIPAIEVVPSEYYDSLRRNNFLLALAILSAIIFMMLTISYYEDKVTLLEKERKEAVTFLLECMNGTARWKTSTEEIGCMKAEYNPLPITKRS